MRIDCTKCEMYQSEHCEDCLVTAVLHPPAGPVEIDQDLDPPLRALAGAGLIPVLKFRPRGSQDERPQSGDESTALDRKAN
ncbi:hypothetical protein BH20ACT23_BH20ACT23_18310 [soil metagenome]